MAVNHITYTPSTPHGTLLRNCLRDLERGFDGLNDLLGVMDQMKDAGEITAYLQGKFGFPDVGTAQAAYAELASLAGKLNTTGEATTSYVRDALLQCFRKFG